MAKILENNKPQLPKVSISVGQKSTLCHQYTQNVKDRFQIRVYKINKERITYFNKLTSVKIKKISDSNLGRVKKIEAHAK